ncbi:MAG: Maf family protein [Sphingomicrobium sp.]
MALVLASSSAIRSAMLDQSGIRFSAVNPDVDEAIEKDRHEDPGKLTRALAQAKALAVSRRRPDDWVIGSDSVVSVRNRIFDKPAGLDEAGEHLRFFSGNRMRLTSAVALARAGAIDWSCCDSAILQVRPLSDKFIANYLDAEWPQVGYCVGVFRLEGRGVQLFDSIDGSYFTILGMPLLPLLAALREREVISS